MIVAASTDCFRDFGLLEALEKLSDLEFSTVEIAVREDGIQLRPSDVVQNVEKAASLCRDTHRLSIVGYSVQIAATGPEHYEQFTACCRLAKATKVALITVPSAELGTPFNEEVEHLRRLVAIATLESTRVAIASQIGRLSEDPDTVTVLCDNVKGLGLTLDVSHYLCGPHSGRNLDKLMKYVFHVSLRDSRKDQLQVRVGQGDVDFGKLISQLRKVHYDRALCVHMPPFPDPEVDHAAELRKLRLLLESLL